MVTNNGKRGGNLVGKPHKDKQGNDVGGIKAVVTDSGGKPVELEGGEVIINKEASKKHWKQLSAINQSAGNGVPIEKPIDPHDEDPQEEFGKGGKIEFNANHLPNKWILSYAKKIKENHPEIWKLGGNVYGNEAFENLKRVAERGYWLDSEQWFYTKWRSFVARHRADFRLAGVVAMLKWADKVDKGWAYMKSVIEAEIGRNKQSKPAAKMSKGGSVDIEAGQILVVKNQLKSGKTVMEAYLTVDKDNPFVTQFKNRSIYCLKFSKHEGGQWHFYNVAVGFTRDEFKELAESALQPSMSNTSLLVGVEKAIVYQIMKYQVEYLLDKGYAIAPLFRDNYGVVYGIEKVDDDLYTVTESFVRKGKNIETANALNAYANLGSNVYKQIGLAFEQAKTAKMSNGGEVSSDCGAFIEQSEAIRNNGYYLRIKDLKNYVADHTVKIPKMRTMVLITYNGGGRKNLKSIDTINATELSKNLANLLEIDLDMARMIVQEQIHHSVRLTKDIDIEHIPVVIADRDKIVCHNLGSAKRFSLGGELIKGVKTEMEHADTIKRYKKRSVKVKDVAKSIAKDHLSEDPQYYAKLSKVESKMAKGGGLTGYEKRIAENFAYMNTDSRNWKSLPITGTTEVSTGKGTRLMPIYEFPQGYETNTLYPCPPNPPYCCELCGKSPIVTIYHITNDKEKLILRVGSECVTHFEEGASGKDNLRSFKIAKAIMLDADMIKLRSEVKRLFNHKKDIGYGRFEDVWDVQQTPDDASGGYNPLLIKMKQDGLFDEFYDKKSSRKSFYWKDVYFKKLPVFGYEQVKQNQSRWKNPDTDEKIEKDLLTWYSRNEKLASAMFNSISKWLALIGKPLNTSDYLYFADSNAAADSIKMEHGGMLEEGDTLPEDLERYFIKTPDTIKVPLAKLTPIRAREKGIANAEKYMRMAYNGEMDRRKPISIYPDGSGYSVADGNSTFAVATKNGWKHIYAQVVNVPEETEHVFASGGGIPFNIDRMRNTLGEVVFNHINSLDTTQLEKHLSALQSELKMLNDKDHRYYRLKEEERYIMYRLDRSGEFQYAKGGKVDMSNFSQVLYREKEGNFLFAKNTIYLWLYDDAEAAQKLRSGEYDYVFFPQARQWEAFQKNYVPPLLRVWTKKFQNQFRGSEKLIGIIEAWLDEPNKKLSIFMMTTRKSHRRQGIMANMIKDLRTQYNIAQEDVIFDSPTENGIKVRESKKYLGGGNTDIMP